MNNTFELHGVIITVNEFDIVIACRPVPKKLRRPVPKKLRGSGIKEGACYWGCVDHCDHKLRGPNGDLKS